MTSLICPHGYIARCKACHPECHVPVRQPGSNLCVCGRPVGDATAHQPAPPEDTA